MPKRKDLTLRRVTGTRCAGGIHRPEEREQRAFDLTIGRDAQVFLRRVSLPDGRLADQQVDTNRLERRKLLEWRGVGRLHAHRQDGSANTLAPALLDLAGGAPGLTEFREDRAAHLGRIAQPRVVFVALEGGHRLGVVEKEIAARAVDALEAAAAQPAGTADPLLHMLAAVPMLELRIVGWIDVDPQRECG